MAHLKVRCPDGTEVEDKRATESYGKNFVKYTLKADTDKQTTVWLYGVKKKAKKPSPTKKK